MSKPIYIITQQRKVFNVDGDRNIISELFTDGKFFCYCLEDEFRADGVKVYGKTAIPAIEYDVAVTMSSRFKREMILLYNQPDLSVQHEGVRFDGVRVHSGNTSEDSHGCVLVAHNTDGKRIWGTSEKDITALVKSKITEGFKVKWRIQMKPFNEELNNAMV